MIVTVKIEKLRKDTFLQKMQNREPKTQTRVPGNRLSASCQTVLSLPININKEAFVQRTSFI
jgi:hypothetical protein